MANGVLVQLAVLSASAAILIGALIMYRRWGAARQEAKAVRPRKLPEPRRVAATAEMGSDPARANNGSASQSHVATGGQTPFPSSSEPAKPAAVIDLEAALSTREERNERILAGISENIRKSLQTRPVPQHSPIPYDDAKPRNTEYVRVKKEIITPHGQIRFSILKDWMSINMLAVLRRASLDWKTPDDLIAFLPAYLEPEAEIIDGQVLLVGTPGHHEKLAIPVRSLDAESRLRECFDFVSDLRPATNTPAVLLPLDAGFEVVSKGVITQAAFRNAVGENHMEVKLLLESPPYSPALQL